MFLSSGDTFYHGSRLDPPDYARAAHHYARADTPHARLQLARMHYHGQASLPSNETFKLILKESVEKHQSADAANLLGCVAASEAEATLLFDKATHLLPKRLPVAHTNAGIMRLLSRDASLIDPGDTFSDNLISFCCI